MEASTLVREGGMHTLEGKERYTESRGNITPTKKVVNLSTSPKYVTALPWEIPKSDFYISLTLIRYPVFWYTVSDLECSLNHNRLLIFSLTRSSCCHTTPTASFQSHLTIVSFLSHLTTSSYQSLSAAQQLALFRATHIL